MKGGKKKKGVGGSEERKKKHLAVIESYPEGGLMDYTYFTWKHYD